MRRLARTLRSAFGSEEEAPRVQHAPSGAGAAPPAAPVGSHREHWMPDESVSACYDCEQLFSLFLRRHHCRLCGRVFCNRCAEQRPITAQAPAADAGAHETQLVRVCNYCYRQRQMEQAAAASDVARLTSAPAARAGATDEAGEQQSAQKASNEGVARLSSDGSAALVQRGTPRAIAGGRATPGEAAQPVAFFLGAPSPNVSRSNSSLLDASRRAATITSAPTTVEWLRRATADLTDVSERGAAGQSASGEDGGGAGTLSRQQQQQEQQEQDQQQETQHEEELPFGNQHPGDANAGSASRSPSPANQAPTAGEGGADDTRRDLSAWLPPQAEALAYLGAEDGPMARAAPFEAMAAHRLQAIVRQELEAEADLSSEVRERWAPVIASLARTAASSLRVTSAQTAHRMHPRHYVKIKRLPWGAREESRGVAGVVCRRNVAHRQMRTSAADCRLMLLRGRLEYQREENRLSSIETVIEQEHGYLRMTVQRIAAAQPDVLLVGGTVSRLARDLLLEAGIVLVLNVRKTLMDRIARATGAEVLQSADDIVVWDGGELQRAVGSCGSFYIEPMLSTEHLASTESASVRTLMFFERCAASLGHTILLHGPAEELAAAKRAMTTAVLAAHHLHLECALLADQAAAVGFTPASTAPILAVSPHVAFLPLPEDFGAPPRLAALQHIHVSLHTDTTATPSAGGVYEGPSLRRLDFYEVADAPLGRFVQSALTAALQGDGDAGSDGEPRWLCTYSHGGGSVTMHTLRLPYQHTLPEDGKIWVWCCPRGRGAELREALLRRPLSDAAGACSFGEFLDRAFNAPGLASLAHPDVSLHRDHERVFASGGAALRVRYDDVRVHRVCLPARFPHRHAGLWDDFVRGEAEALVATARGAFDQVRDALAGLGASFGEAGDGNEEAAEQIFARLRVLAEALATEERVFSAKLLEASAPPLHPPSKTVLKERAVKRALLERLTASNGAGAVVQNADDNDDDDSHVSCNTPHMLAQPDPFELYRLTRLLTASMRTWVSTLNDFDAKLPRHRRGNSATVNAESDTAIASAVEASSEFGVLERGAPTPPDEKGDDTRAQTSKHRRTSSLSAIENASDGLAESARAAEDSRQRAPSSQTPTHRRGKSAVPFMHAISAGNGSILGSRQVSFAPSDGGAAMPALASLLSGVGRIVASSPGVGDTVIPIFDDEPTSVIAHALASQDFGRNLVAARRAAAGKPQPNARPAQSDGMAADEGPSQRSTPRASPLRERAARSTSCASAEDASVQQTALRATMEGSEPVHVRFALSDDGASSGSCAAQYSVTAYYAAQFDAMRRLALGNADFVRSLSRCRKWHPRGGKSGAFFAKTADDRFVVKQVGRTELIGFLGFAPAYFQYIARTLCEEDEESGTPSASALAKVLGVFQVTIKPSRGENIKMDLLVMENLLYGRAGARVERVYDLKGSMRSRYINPQGGDSGSVGADCSQVLLDENLVEHSRTAPLYVDESHTEALERAVLNDTAFLSALGVMDYSLLVAVVATDSGGGELVVGIIDWVRQYTWDKQVETWVKSSALLGASKDRAPTVISPAEYKDRFRSQMSAYFNAMPNQLTHLAKHAHP